MANFYKWTKLKIWINDIVTESLVDTGTDVTIILSESWHPNWSLHNVNVWIGTLSQVNKSMRWVEYIGPEGYRGILKQYVANIAMNLWGCDLL